MLSIAVTIAHTEVLVYENEGAEPGDSSLTVEARSSDDLSSSSSWMPVTDGVNLAGMSDGQYLEIKTLFTRSSSDGDGDQVNDSPILSDLKIVKPSIAIGIPFLPQMILSVMAVLFVLPLA